MFLNLQYAIGINGSWRKILRHFPRYFYCGAKVRKNVCSDLKKVLVREQPDVLCLVETYADHVRGLLDENYTFYDVESKYGIKSFLRKMPGFRRRSNAFLARKDLDFQKHFLKNGAKKLIYEMKISEDTGLFMGHFSLFKNIRKRQFTELTELARKYKKVIICGDFNIFSGYKELEFMLESLDLTIVERGGRKTFPSGNPRLHLDLFLCSRDMEIKEMRVLEDQLSDHLSIILEI